MRGLCDDWNVKITSKPINSPQQVTQRSLCITIGRYGTNYRDPTSYILHLGGGWQLIKSPTGRKQENNKQIVVSAMMIGNRTVWQGTAVGGGGEGGASLGFMARQCLSKELSTTKRGTDKCGDAIYLHLSFRVKREKHCSPPPPPFDLEMLGKPGKPIKWT